ncbi:unnamed protein product [Clonostachys byssicola]|uniref:LPXTG-motif cell wall anchor domain protein n=1 Tax=Clonostachys byssicola TaxID=160290 RepID=A0A9N9XY17_9HYPO|nr:unnamed protein product [Clonostachys byssicola]
MATGFTTAGLAAESIALSAGTSTAASSNTGATVTNYANIPTASISEVLDPKNRWSDGSKQGKTPPERNENGCPLDPPDLDRVTSVSQRRALSMSPSLEASHFHQAATLVPVNTNETQPNGNQVAATRSQQRQDLQSARLQRRPSDPSSSSRRFEPVSPPSRYGEITSPYSDSQPLSPSRDGRPQPSPAYVSSYLSRRKSSSRSSFGAAIPYSPQTHDSQDAQYAEISPGFLTDEALSPKQLPSGQRELLLPKTLSQQTSQPEERRVSSHHPPVSYKPPINATAQQPGNAPPVRVPPIRAFRSSGSRKSLTLDMNYKDYKDYKGQLYESGDESNESNHDYTLRALEGRSAQPQDRAEITPPMSAKHDTSDADDGGDVFLKIAREESMRRSSNRRVTEDIQSPASRVFRSHRRPLSTTVAAYQPDSPPRIARRLSDQEQSSSRRMDDAVSEIARTLTQRSMSRDKAMSAHPAAMDDAVSDFARTLTQRSMSRDKAMSAHPLDDAVTEIARNLTQRSMSRDKAMSAHPLDDSHHRSRHSGSALRPSPLTPRSTTLPDSLSDNPIHTRRRSSVTDQNTTPPTRSTTYRSSGSTVQVHGKTYHSSPLVRSFDLVANRKEEPAQAVEGTESTASTTAPSTVWDELDDLKSRMRRLELTGKLPPTSGAAVSRLTDERPPTATTTVTTVSSSPKRVVVASQANDGASAVGTAQHESFPVLHSALAKSKPFLNPEIFRALETAATEAMSLSSMMGTSGQPGPISSGASGIGSGGNITDRQLRRKADSVCRSLTELCVALGEDVAHSRPPQVSHSQKSSLSKPQVQQAPQIAQEEGPRTPTINKSFNTMTSLSSQKRPSMAAEGSASKPSSTVTSPSRALSKFEERRNTLLNANTLPSPRATGSGPPTPQDANANRRSSLLVARSRRAVTEEPEEVTGRRSSLLLRSRRGATEEPEESRQPEGRQTSLLYRTRRGTAGEGDDEARFTTPSRAYTEVNSSRGLGREYTEVATSSRLPTRDFNPQSQLSPQDASHTSALPRRRFMSGTTGISRLATPAAPTTTTLPTRKYVERSTHERRDSVGAERTERSQKRYSLGANTILTSGVSLGPRRQNRDSTIPNITTTTAAGNYR